MIELIVVFFLISSVLKNYKVLKSIDFLKKKVESNNSSTNYFPHILLPVYNEQNIIQETYDYYRDFKDIIPHQKISFVQSAKELSSNLSRTTFQTIENKDYTFFQHVQCPIQGSKATQLNYFITEHTNNKEWLLILDVDSRISKSDLLKISNLIPSLSQNTLYQLPSSYITNYNTLPLFQKIIGAMHTSFGFYQEIYPNLNNTPAHLYKYQSLIGHGLIINKQLLSSIGGFPDPIEDSRLAFKAIAKNIPIKYLNIFDTATTPKSILDYINQTSGWFYGQLFIFENISLKNKPTLRQVLKYMDRLWLSLWWLSKSYVIVGILIYIILNQKYELFITFSTTLIISYIADSIVVYFFHKKIYYETIVYGFIGDLIYSLGPTLFWIKWIRKSITQDIHLLPKTPK